MPATTGAPGPGTGPPGAASSLAAGSRWRRVFPGEESQLRALRRWLASLLPDCPARDDVASVATELCSNAIRHTASGQDGSFAVEIIWLDRPAGVRLAVADGGAPAGPRMIDDPMAENGRGLMLVHGLSARTGVAGDEHGRVVWADIPWPEAGYEVPAAAGDPYEATVRAGLAALAAQFAGVPIWFGRATLQWWALVDRGYASRLVSAASPEELAVALAQALAALPPLMPGSPGADATVTWLGRRDRGPGVAAVSAQYRPRPARSAYLDPAAGFAAAPTPGAEPASTLARNAS
jgi:anti-sigma regulatory factor (Ser/Thr protein kinase)